MLNYLFGAIQQKTLIKNYANADFALQIMQMQILHDTPLAKNAMLFCITHENNAKTRARAAEQNKGENQRKTTEKRKNRNYSQRSKWRANKN